MLPGEGAPYKLLLAASGCNYTRIQHAAGAPCLVPSNIVYPSTAVHMLALGSAGVCVNAAAAAALAGARTYPFICYSDVFENDGTCRAQLHHSMQKSQIQYSVDALGTCHGYIPASRRHQEEAAVVEEVGHCTNNAAFLSGVPFAS
jgi:hypothetical protein